MDITIKPTRLSGRVPAIPSKSQAHRMLICAAFADSPTVLVCPLTNRDIDATADCLRALGAGITYEQGKFYIRPIKNPAKAATLPCQESGSTLRFLLPVAGALGVDATFTMSGRLPQRPLSPLWEELERMGCTLTRLEDGSVLCKGRLRCGSYSIDGGVSSQFITGLLLALPLIDGETSLEITGSIESKPYLAMTRQVLQLFKSKQPQYTVEGDWSNAAFFLAAGALGSAVSVTGLSDDSFQGDRCVKELLTQLSKGFRTICARDIPDLIPILSVVAAAEHGAEFTHIQRLRLKESDRVAATVAMLKSLGCKAEATEDTLTVHPSAFTGGVVDGRNDHRIVMSAAIAATLCTAPVTILGAQAVNKSYPDFWAQYRLLGGQYE